MPKLIMLCGLPASGKSFYAGKLAKIHDAKILSSDEMRKQLFGDVNEQNRNQELFAEILRVAKDGLSNNHNIIIDATSINYKRRRDFINKIKKIDCEKLCYLIATPYEICLQRNKERDRMVPEHVIKRMYFNFFIPQYYEGWDKISIIRSSVNKNYYNFNTLFEGDNGLDFIDQENQHHTLTIGQHCKKTAYNLISLGVKDHILNLAAILHDIGKRETKTFKNYKGETTKEAHYYNHQLVSAYNAMFYLCDYTDEKILKICNYIQWHMQPFFIKTEKAKDKFIKLVGKDFYNKLMILHEADKNAK